MDYEDEGDDGPADLLAVGAADRLAASERFDHLADVGRRLLRADLGAVTILDGALLRPFGLARTKPLARVLTGAPPPSPSNASEDGVSVNYAIGGVLLRGPDEVLFVEDAASHPTTSSAPSVVDGSVGACIAAKLHGPDGGVLGTVTFLYREPHAFHPDDRHNVEEMARWAEREITEHVEAGRLAAVRSAFTPQTTHVPGYAVASGTRSARKVCGDIHDVFASRDGRSLAMTVADVMGKGTPAGLLAANLQGAFDALREESPASAVEAAEAAIRGRFERASAFATLFHARLRLQDGRVEYVDAGHGFAVHAKADGSTTRLRSVDLPIGLQPDRMPRMPRSLSLEPGDVLLVATDGILEIPNASLHTLTSLAAELTRSASMQATLDRFLCEAAVPKVLDDITLLAVQREA